MKFRWILAIAVLITLASALGGVVHAQQAPKLPDTLLNDCADCNPDSLDPTWAFDTGSFGYIQQVYEPLVAYDHGDISHFLPVLATDVPTVNNGGITSDGLNFTFHIRQGVQFHDGTSLTPEDVQHSYYRMMVIDRDSGPSFLLNTELANVTSTRDNNGNLIQEVSIPDLNKERPDHGQNVSLAAAIRNSIEVKGNDVIIHLAIPFAPFLQVIAGGQSHIISKNFALPNGDWPGFTGDDKTDMANIAKFNNPSDSSKTALYNKVNGTGPFKLVSWDPATATLLFDANTAYRNGASKLAHLSYKNVPDYSARKLELQAGDVDLIDLGTRANVPDIEQVDGSLTIDDLPNATNTNSIFFNYLVKGANNPNIGTGKAGGTGVPPTFFQNIHVRKAFNLVFDHDLFIKDVLLGKGITPATPIPGGMVYYNPGQLGVGQDPTTTKYDIAANLKAAETEFKAAGFTPDPGPPAAGQSVWDVGFTLTCTYNVGNLGRQTACQLLKNNLENLNSKFHVTVNAEPFSVIVGKDIPQGNLALYPLGWIDDYLDPADFFPQWLGSNALGATFSGPGSIDQLKEWATPGTTPGGVSYQNWDDLINKGLQATDPKVRQDIYYTLQKLYVDNALDIMLSQPIEFRTMRSWVGGWYYNPSSPGFPDPSFYEFSKAADATPNVTDICKHFQGATFHYGKPGTAEGDVKTCKDFGK